MNTESIAEAGAETGRTLRDSEVGAECVLVPMTRKQLAILVSSSAMTGMTLYSSISPELQSLVIDMSFNSLDENTVEEEFLALLELPNNAQPASSPLCPTPDFEATTQEGNIY